MELVEGKLLRSEVNLPRFLEFKISGVEIKLKDFKEKIPGIWIIKGTVTVVSSDPPGKDGNARFTTVSLI